MRFLQSLFQPWLLSALLATSVTGCVSNAPFGLGPSKAPNHRDGQESSPRKGDAASQEIPTSTAETSNQLDLDQSLRLAHMPSARSSLLMQSMAEAPALEHCDHAEISTCSITATPTPSSDLWTDLRAGFVLDPTLNRPEVQAQLDWFKRNPDYVDRVFKRGAPYLPHILETVAAAGLPHEFVLLPVIESAFDPFAYSPERASGLWQFIPATARLYGLKIDWWYDGRRDLIDSTEAATRFLSDLGQSLDQDWPLVLAGYNAGIGTVGKSIRKNARLGSGTTYWDLALPRETRSYVPKLLALAEIVRNPEHYQMTLPEIGIDSNLAQVSIPHQIDLAKAAELSEESLDTIYRLNPGFNQWATHPEGPHRLILPKSKTALFTLALSNLPPNERLRWIRHRIKAGETLGGIAHRYGLSVKAIQQINGLDGSLIVAGKPLLIPQAAQAHYPLSLAGRELGRVDRFEKTLKQTAQQYRVIHGDSLWSIARKHGVSVSDLTQWNGLSAKKPLSVGQTLAIFEIETATNSVIEQNVQSLGPADRRIRSISYRVRSGDSLSKIAARFNTSIEQITRWNTALVGERYLQPGDRITLRLDVKKAL
jgi:membrane-bound lytic murein transglycosylase D